MAAALVIVGYNLSGPAQVYVLNMGLFALSGGVTNWLAIHMLFERVPGFYGSGVIPLRFEEFKVGIRALIMEQFFNQADFKAFLHSVGEADGGASSDTSDAILEKLKQAIDKLDLDSAFESLVEVIMASSFASMLGMFGGKDALNPLKAPFVEKMRDYFRTQFSDPDFREHIQEALDSVLNDEKVRMKLEQVIDRRLDQMTPQMVKEIIQAMIKKHLGWLVVWGCFFGGVIGLVVTYFSA